MPRPRRPLTYFTGLAVLALLLAAGRPEQTIVPPERSPRSEALALALAPDASASSSDTVDGKILHLQTEAHSKGPSALTLEQLGWAFVEKARVSGDHGYYLLAESCAHALRELRPSLQQDADCPEADLLEGHALLSLHRFAEAEAVASHLARGRGAALDWALYGDTLLDQGRIDEAVSAYGRMMNKRPDSRAYARVAEVRLLTGDGDGAREALRTAARAVSMRDAEAFAWIWSRLAILELQGGDAPKSLSIAKSAVAASPSSPVASLALGRILLAGGDTGAAIDALERSTAKSPLPEAERALADAYTAAGRDDDASRVLQHLEATGEVSDPRSFSLWLSETGRDPARALALARTELDQRKDIYTFDALAMAELAAGNIDAAREHMSTALAVGTEDPRLWYHAGLLAAASKQDEESRRWLEKALAGSQILLPSLRRDLERRLEAAQPAQT